MRLELSWLKRFISKVTISNKQTCWVWQDSLTKSGYGQMKVAAKMVLAHRLSWIIHNGSIPKGTQVLHQCDNPSCVNPNHLFLGDHDDNMKDMAKKKRARISKGEQNPNARLKTSDVRAIKKASAIGYKRRELAKMFGVHLSQIDRIINGKCWSDI